MIQASRWFSIIFYTPFLVGCSATSYWYSVHADSSNSDYSPVEGPRNITLAWKREFGGTINLGATNDAFGKVFVTTSGDGCHLYALDHPTGETIWCTDEVNKYAVASSALIDNDGHVYIADNSHMFAFDNGGHLIWRTAIAGFPLSAQFTRSGRLIFITHIGVIYVLNRGTGRPCVPPYELSEGAIATGSAFAPVECMRGTAGCPCANTLAIDRRSDTFYFTYWEPGTIQADLLAIQFNGSGFSRLWRNSTLPGGSASSPDISANGKRIYVNDNVGALHAIDATTGEEIWSYDTGYATGGSQSTSPTGLIVPAGGSKATLLCIRDAGDSAQLMWRNEGMINRGIATQTAGGLTFATIADDEKGRPYNYIAVIETKSGQLIDREDLPGATFFTVGTTVGPEGNIYIPSFNGSLFAFKAENKGQVKQ